MTTWGGRPAGRRKPTHPETALQAAIVSFHGAAVDQRHAVLFSVPNGDLKDAQTVMRVAGITAEQRELLPEGQCLRPFGQGVLAGVSDLILLLPGGRLVLIEVKVPRVTAPAMPLFPKAKKAVVHEAGRQSKSQKRFEAGAILLGHEYRIIRGVEEYADLLEAQGVPLRCRPWGPGVSAPRQPAAFKP